MIENVLDKDILSFEIEKSCIDEKKVIGSFQKNTATIELLNPDNKYSNLKGTYINTYKGTFFVDDISPIQEKIKIKLSCYDLTQKFDTSYDKNKFVFPMTLKEWKNSICNIVGVEYDDSDFPNCDYQLNSEPYIKKDATYKDVIKLIAQASSCWAIIDYDDKLYFNWFNDNNVIDVNDWIDLTTEDNPSEPVNIVVLGRGDVEDNVIYPESEPENAKEIRIDSNDILDLDRKGMIVPIYDQVNNFKYIVFDMKTKGFLNAKVGDKIKYPDLYLNPKESYIMSHTLTFLGGDYNDERNYTSKFKAIELDETNTNYEYAESPEQKLDRTERLANKLDGQILDIIEKTEKYDSKISEVEQTVDKINQKVSEVADLTREIISNKYIELNDAISGNLINLKITGEISILPSKHIYPSENLFPHDAFYLKVTNEGTDEESGETILKSTRYKLPFYSLHQYGDVRDEFIINNGKVKLIKKIGIDENDNKYLLTQPIEQTFDDIVIDLKDGYNRFELVDFTSATLSVKYAIQSEYSRLFATKVELNSSITQTKNEINLQVSKKVDENEIISTINQSAEEIKIKANKIGLEGYTTINKGFSVDEEGNASMNNATMTGGNITIYDTSNDDANIKFVDKDNSNMYSSIASHRVLLNSEINNINIYNSDDCNWIDLNNNQGNKYIYIENVDTHNYISLYDDSNDAFLSIDSTGSGDGNPYFRVQKGSSFSSMSQNGVWSPSFNNNSLKEVKKNIKKLTTDAVKLITSTDLYKYNYKDESNKDKKHIGIVIGDGYNYPEEILSSDGEGVDLYSMISVCFKAIQEQQVQIQELKNEINKLKEGDK